MANARPHSKGASTPTPEELSLFESLWSSGGLGSSEAVSQHLQDRARHKGQPSSPVKARSSYGAWYMPTGDWKSVYGGSTEDEESIQAKLGKVSSSEVQRRHQLEHQRANLQEELSKTYTVRVFREYVQERNVREPMVMANVSAASDGVIRARNAQHALRENRAAGSRTATDALVGLQGQQAGAGPSKSDPYFGLSGGVRFLADGIRPSDLDIDEILAPEMREMVRRTLAMNDRLQEHAVLVKQMQQQRQAKDTEWAKVLSKTKKSAASSHGSSSSGKGYRARSTPVPIPTAAVAATAATAAIGESQAPMLTKSTSVRFVGTSGAGAAPPPPSANQAASPHGSRVVSSSSAVAAQSAELEEPSSRCSFERDGAAYLGGFFVTNQTAEQLTRRSEGSLPPFAQPTATPPGTPSHGARGSKAHSTASAASAAGHDAEVPSLKLEALAGRSDLPFGVRYLAALGAATAGAPPPGSPLARKAEQQELQRGASFEDKSKRWQHDRVPTLHFAMQAATSGLVHGSQGQPGIGTPPHTPTAVGPGSPLMTHKPVELHGLLHGHHHQRPAHTHPVAEEMTSAEEGDHSMEDAPVADSNVGGQLLGSEPNQEPHHNSHHLHHHHHHRHHQTYTVATSSHQAAEPAEDEEVGGNLSLAWLSGERVRHANDKPILNSRSGSALGLASSSRLARQGSAQPWPQSGVPASPASSTARPQSRIQTAPHAASPARGHSPIARPGTHQSEKRPTLRRFSGSEHQQPAWLRLNSPSRSPASFSAGPLRRLAFEEL